MIRRLLTIALPLLTPFVVYFVWAWAARRRAQAQSEGRPLPPWQELPWAWLIIAGAGLTAVTLVLSAVLWVDNRPGIYRPPRLENGVIIPGHIEPLPQSPAKIPAEAMPDSGAK